MSQSNSQNPSGQSLPDVGGSNDSHAQTTEGHHQQTEAHGQNSNINKRKRSQPSQDHDLSDDDRGQITEYIRGQLHNINLDSDAPSQNNTHGSPLPYPFNRVGHMTIYPDDIDGMPLIPLHLEPLPDDGMHNQTVHDGYGTLVVKTSERYPNYPDFAKMGLVHLEKIFPVRVSWKMSWKMGDDPNDRDMVFFTEEGTISEYDMLRGQQALTLIFTSWQVECHIITK